MWIEVIDSEGKTMGAVNSEACDLIKIGADGPTGRAIIRNAQTNEAMITRVSYLRLIESLSLCDVKTAAQLASMIDESNKDPLAPRMVMP